MHTYANISRVGDDIKKNEKVLTNGDLLTPAKVGVLAALGIKDLRVYAKCKTAIIPTGNEVCAPNEPLLPGKVYDVNSYTIASILEKNNCEYKIFDIVEDVEKKIEHVLDNASKIYDLIIVSGGSSVGEKDFIAKIVNKHGKIYFHGVNIKPGKPTLFGKYCKCWIFALPGYPTSCLLSTYLFVVPLIMRIARLPEKHPNKINVKHSQPIKSQIGIYEFITVYVKNGISYPVFKESSAITSMANATGYITIPPEIDYIPKGDNVEVTLF